MQGTSREEASKYVYLLLKKYPDVMFGRFSCPTCVSSKTFPRHYDKNSTTDRKTVQEVFCTDLKGSLWYPVSTRLQYSTGRKDSPFIYFSGIVIVNNVLVRVLATKHNALSYYQA